MTSASHRAVAIKSDGRRPSSTAVRHGRPLRPSAVDVADGRGGWPWRTAVVDEEVQNFQEKALHLLQHLLPLVARLSKSVIEFQG
jgi:hypothetical protein